MYEAGMEKRIRLKQSVFVLLLVAAALGIGYSINEPRSAYVNALDPGLLNGCYVGPVSKATIRAGNTLSLGSGEVANILQFSEENNYYWLVLSWNIKGIFKFDNFGTVYWEQRPHQAIEIPMQSGATVILTKAPC